MTTNAEQNPTPEQNATAEQQTSSDASAIWTELRDPTTGHYVGGWGVIVPGATVEESVLADALTYHHGAGWERLVREVQHLHHMRRVKRCSNYGGFGCDMEGDWHEHWFGVKHNPAAPSCCYTLALAVWPQHRPAWSTTAPAATEPAGPHVPTGGNHA